MTFSPATDTFKHMGIDVSIIIVNYKTTNLIIDCLKSLFTLTKGLTYEIIIIDNASDPDFQEKIENEFPDFNHFRFIQLSRNLGFGQANNEGVKYAVGRNILYLNPDTVLLNNAIYNMSVFLDGNTRAGACGGNLFSEEMKPNLSFRRFLPGVRWEINELLNRLPEKLLYGKRMKHETTNRICEVGYITGADLMVKKEVLDLTGGFAPEFFMYYEETDLCARIKRKGWKIYCIPQAHIQHLDGKSFSTKNIINPFKIDTIEKSHLIYYNRNLKGIRSIVAKFTYSIFLKSRILLLPTGEKKNYYKLRYNSFIKYEKLL